MPDSTTKSLSAGRLLRFLLLPILVAILAAPTTAEASVAVRGTVLGPDEAPVVGAAVTLHPVSTRHALGTQLLAGRPGSEAVVTVKTGENGRFALRAPDVGMWRLQVHSDGRVPAQIRLTPLLESVELEPVVLPVDAGLEVRVLDHEHRPVAEAPIAAYRPAPDFSRPSTAGADYSVPRWHSAPFLTRTDESGWIRIPAFAGEVVTVQVAAPGFPHAVATLEQRANREARVVLEKAPTVPLVALDPQGRRAADVIVFADGRPYPLGKTGADGVLPVALVPGRKTWLGLSTAERRWHLSQVEVKVPESPEQKQELLELVLRPPLRVSGRVVDDLNRESVAGALVWPRGFYAYGAVSDRNGAFVLELESDQGFLEAGRSGYRPGRGAHLSNLLTAGQGSLEAVALELIPVASAAGQVVDPWGEGIPGARIHPMPKHLGLRVASSDAEHVLTGEDGVFRLDRLLTGRPYHVRLRAPETAATTDDPGPVFADTWIELDPLSPGEARQGLLWTLDPARHGEGWVVDENDRPVAGAQVTLRRRGSVGSLRSARIDGPPDVYQATTDLEGRFRVPRIAAEIYDLAVQASGYAPARIPGIGLPEEELIIPGPWDLGTVTLAPGSTISGRVRDPDGRGIEGANVQADLFRRGSPFEAEHDPVKITTDAEGRFTVTDLAAGQTLQLDARAEGFLPAGGTIVRSPDDEVDIVLQRGTRLTGRVVDTFGRPVSQARVSLQPEESSPGFDASRSISAACDDDGTFELGPVPVGRATVRVSSRRHLGTRRSIQVPGLDEPPLYLEFTLESGARLRGRVTLDDGTPAVGAQVSAFGKDPQGNQESYSARTDAEGQFAMEGLPQGALRVSAYKEPFAQVHQELTLDGDEAYVELQFEGGFPVTGRVTDSRGRPVAGASIFTAHKEGRSSGLPVTSDSDGRFRLEQVPPGDYEIRAGLPDGRSGSETVRVTGPTDGLVLSVDGGGTVLRGRIEGLELDELARANITVQGPRRLEGAADWNGDFEISGLGEGSWEVFAHIPEDGRSARAPLEVAPGQAEAEVVIEFRPGFEVRGTVRLNGAPAGGLILLLNHPEAQRSFQGLTLHDGTFRIRDVPSGDYKLYIYGTSGQSFRRQVTVDGDLDLQIEPITSRVSGRVVDPEGRPIPRATVSLKGSSELSGNPTDSADFEGRFSFPAVEAGTWTLTVRNSGYREVIQELDVRGGGDPALERLVFTLQRAATYRFRPGTPVDLSGGLLLGVVTDETGRRRGGGFLRPNEGVYHLDTLPPGPSTLWLQRGFGAMFAFPIVARDGEASPVETLPLPPAGRIQLRTSPGTSPGPYRTTVTGPDGEPLPLCFDHQGDVGPVATVYPGLTFYLPVGTWTVRLERDGALDERVVSVGAETETILELP